MTTRTFTAGRVLLDGALAPVAGRAIQATLDIPGGGPAISLESAGIVPDTLTAVTNGSGAYSFTLAYTGDLSPAGCQWVIAESNNVTIVQPVDWVYASSVDPWTWYLAGQGRAGTLSMSYTLEKGDITAVTYRFIHISPQQNTIAPDSSELSVSASIDAPLDGAGRAGFYLWPTLSLTPNTYYTCRIDGETTKLSFSVPDHPTGYVGAYDGATTYHVHDGAAYQGPYVAGKVAPDVVSYNGAYYVTILDGSGHLPTNATYFAPWVAEPITWHLTPFGTVQGIPVAGSAIADATTGSTGVVELRTAASGAHPIALTVDDLGAASGVAELDSGSHVPLSELSGITHTQLSASAGITAGQVASVNPSALTGSGTVPAAGLPDATTALVGGVEIDHAPGSGHPVALTHARLNASSGVAGLLGDMNVPSMSLPARAGALAEAGRWVRGAHNPIIASGSPAWKALAAAEPCLRFDDGEWRLWFAGQPAGGEFSSGIGYASCPGTADPTNGANWTEYGSNPVLGPCALEPNCIRLPSGSYRMFYSDHRNLLVADSADGKTSWSSPITVIATGTLGNVWWNHSAVWQEPDGTWHLIANGGSDVGGWQLYHLTGTNGTTFTLDGFGPLTTISPGGITGRPAIPFPHRRNGIYHMWTHASTSGVNADLYHVSSPTPDFHAATILGGAPILTHLGSGIELVQIADPSVIEVYGTSYIAYDGDTGSTAGVCIATFDGTLAQLIDGSSAGGAGTVTSVAATVPGILSVSGSPITSSGTLAFSLATQAANIVFSGPTSGGSATPTFRALVAADIPSLAASKITTGQLAQARGGTGIDSSAATDGQLLIGKTSDGSLTLATLTAGSNVTITNAGAAITIASSGGGGGSLELTDGSTDLTSVTKITVSGGVVGGTAGAATLTIVGGTTHYEPLCDTTGSVYVDSYGNPLMALVAN